MTFLFSWVTFYKWYFFQQIFLGWIFFLFCFSRNLNSLLDTKILSHKFLSRQVGLTRISFSITHGDCWDETDTNLFFASLSEKKSKPKKWDLKNSKAAVKQSLLLSKKKKKYGRFYNLKKNFGAVFLVKLIFSVMVFGKNQLIFPVPICNVINV